MIIPCQKTPNDEAYHAQMSAKELQALMPSINLGLLIGNNVTIAIRENRGYKTKFIPVDTGFSKEIPLNNSLGHLDIDVTNVKCRVVTSSRILDKANDIGYYYNVTFIIDETFAIPFMFANEVGNFIKNLQLGLYDQFNGTINAGDDAIKLVKKLYELWCKDGIITLE